MSKIPKVTIIMATYNRAHFIVETLLSIQVQTFRDWKCLIIDDGGIDNTPEVIAQILEKDNRFQFLKRPETYKKGLPGCRNYGLDLAKGDYVIFFDDDDITHPDNLKICLEVIEENAVDFCHYQKLSYEVEQPAIENKPISIKQYLTKVDIEKIITQEIGLSSCTVMWKKQCFENCRFDENLLYAEEWECYSKLITEGFKGVIVENILYYNRKHLNSNTGEFYRNDSIRRESYKEAILLVIKNLKEKKLLSYSLLRYFIQISRDFKEFNLFIKITGILKLSKFEKFKWQVFYYILPFRLWFYGIWKNLKMKS
ncbi:MAG: glycosyltransferase family 2 protein [Lutibacter sp.]|nr:glycosyltransferase family 2 protein [Lutibacter sp.]